MKKNAKKPDIVGIEKCIYDVYRKIHYQIYTMSFDKLIALYNKNQLATDEFRLNKKQAFWCNSKRSRFIESVVVGFPMTSMAITVSLAIFDNNYNNKYFIIDGVSRVGSVISFVEDGFKLEGLNLVPKLNGLNFSDLPTSCKDKFLRTEFRIIDVGYFTDDVIKEMIFERSNGS